MQSTQELLFWRSWVDVLKVIENCKVTTVIYEKLASPPSKPPPCTFLIKGALAAKVVDFLWYLDCKAYT